MHFPTVSEMSAPERARALARRAVIALDPAGSAWRYQVTVGQWDQRPDELIDVPAYLYLVHKADLQLDPWRVVDGVDRQTQADSYDVWLGNGACLPGKPADFQVYVGEFQYLALTKHLVEVGLRSARAADHARERG